MYAEILYWTAAAAAQLYALRNAMQSINNKIECDGELATRRQATVLVFQIKFAPT